MLKKIRNGYIWSESKIHPFTLMLSCGFRIIFTCSSMVNILWAGLCWALRQWSICIIVHRTGLNRIFPSRSHVKKNRIKKIDRHSHTEIPNRSMLCLTQYIFHRGITFPSYKDMRLSVMSPFPSQGSQLTHKTMAFITSPLSNTRNISAAEYASKKVFTVAPAPMLY